MCTYSTEHVRLTGTAKGGRGWRGLGETTVYFDHPVHAQALHTLNIDFGDPAGRAPGRRGPRVRGNFIQTVTGWSGSTVHQAARELGRQVVCRAPSMPGRDAGAGPGAVSSVVWKPGTRMVELVPFPAWLTPLTSPPCASTIALTIARPSPPEAVEQAAEVLGLGAGCGRPCRWRRRRSRSGRRARPPGARHRRAPRRRRPPRPASAAAPRSSSA